MDIYEDLKILIIDSSSITDAEYCGYEEYQFAVRKEYLLKWLNSVADHEITEDAMNDWLRNEYVNDDSFLLYKQAQAEDEIVFEGPVWGKFLQYYEVTETVITKSETTERVVVKTMNFDRARDIYEYKREKNFAGCRDSVCETESGAAALNSSGTLFQYRVSNRDEGVYILKLKVIEVEF